MENSCTIEFDKNPYGTYFAGQMLSGKVTMKTTKAKPVKGIVLKVNGFAHTCWAEKRGQVWVMCRGHEDYIASITYLLGSEENSSVNIQPGMQTYNFVCQIPINCPSSIEGKNGHVRYTVKVVLIRPWKFDQTYARAFTVLKTLDLNYESPILRAPVRVEIDKTFYCGPCRSDPLKVHVTLPQSAYVPGQNIPVSVLIANESSVQVKEIKVKLLMHVKYFSQSVKSTRAEHIVVTKLTGEGVLRQCNKNFTYDLYVPATPPTCSQLCSLIHISYEVKVDVKAKKCHTNQLVFIPVIIGNVPLMNIITQQPTSSRAIGMECALLDATTLDQSTARENINIKHNGIQVMNIEDINGIQALSMAENEVISNPPPSYEEAVHMQRANINADEKHIYSASDFAPRYPVFNVPSAATPEQQ